MADRRIYELATKSAALGANDYFAVDNGTEAESKKLPTSYFTDQLADINNILGAKNILRYPYFQTTRAESGMTITDNGDGSITISGTATARVVFRFADNAQVPAFTPPAGTYKLVVSGNSAGLYINFDAYNNVTWVKNLATIHGNGISASFDVDYNGYDKVTGYIDIPSGTAITTPITIKPMIVPAHIEDTIFVPYAKTNNQLTDDVADLNSALSTVKQSLIPSYQSLGESGVRGSGFVIKYDKVVILQIILKTGKAITANSSYRILELGASFRPSHSISQDGRLYQGADYRVTVNTSGNVDLYVAQNITVSNAQIAFIYLLE